MALDPDGWFIFPKSQQKLGWFGIKTRESHQDSNDYSFSFQDSPIYRRAWQRGIDYLISQRSDRKAVKSNLTELTSWW